MKEKICPQCKKVFKPKDPRNTFCSHECAYEYRRTIPGKNIEKLRLYRIWSHMIRRCYKQKSNDYKNYGARGIIICDDWKNSFLNFYDWSMCNGYNDTLSIDRIDVNGNYEPDNCRWVDLTVQNNNKRTNHIITVNGYTDTIANCCRKFNVSIDVILDRLKLGWSVEKAFNCQLKKKYNLLTYKNETHSIKEWSKLSNIPYHTLLYRIKQNWDIHDIFEIPYQYDRIKIQYKDSYMSIKELAKKFNSTSLQVYKEVFNENNH